MGALLLEEGLVGRDMGREGGVLGANAGVVVCLVAHEGGEGGGEDDAAAGEEVREALGARGDPLAVFAESCLYLGNALGRSEWVLGGGCLDAAWEKKGGR